MTQTQITDAVCHTHTAGIQLVLTDEIHRLNPRTTTGTHTADLLKDLTERLPATFVHTGIDVFESWCIALAHPYPARARLCRRAMPSMAWGTPSLLRRWPRKISKTETIIPVIPGAGRWAQAAAFP
jgi:hypothetical protein